MTKKDEKVAAVCAVIALLLFLWWFLRSNPGTAQAIQQATGLPVTAVPGVAAPETFNIPALSPYQAPSISVPTLQPSSPCGCGGNIWASPAVELIPLGNPSSISPPTDNIQQPFTGTLINYTQPFGGSDMFTSLGAGVYA